MKTNDFLIVALAPFALLWIPLVGNMFIEGWNWKWNDFVFGWVVIATAIFVFRLIVTRKFANFAYKAGAGLAVLTGFLVTWISAAVQIIGHENPANMLYLAVILTGLVGTGLARFQPAGMAKAAFATAGVTFLVPVVAVIFWPTDFSPGIPQVFMLNGFFVLMFASSGLFFRQASNRTNGSSVATPA